MAAYPYNTYAQYQPYYQNYLYPANAQQLSYSGYASPLAGQQPNYVNYTTPAQPAQAYQAQNPVQQNSGIIWVQGEAGAKSYLVGAGQSVLLMDSENSSFYIKSTDASGMPLPLRVFDYTERGSNTENVAVAAQPQTQDFVTHDELKRWSDKLKSSILKEGRQDGRKPSV